MRWYGYLLYSSVVLSVAMAVDRSKFRTCQQTSFCRRHRQTNDATTTTPSSPLFRYRLVKDSVHFYIPEMTKDSMDGEQPAQDPKTHSKEESVPNVWQSLQRRLMGGGGNSGVLENDSKKDAVLGPTPTLTATLQNYATVTPTSWMRKNQFGINKNSKQDNVDEYLNLSITALSDGMVRIRITEMYGVPDTPTQWPRITYDALVLHHPEQWIAAHEAVWWRTGDEITSHLSDVLHLDNTENYMALQFSNGMSEKEGTLVLIQLEPFVISLYRMSDLALGPLIQLNAADLMHFEIRQEKQSSSPADEQQPSKKIDSQTSDQAPKVDNAEKEIVGYWEDGLAIYADGTREERKKDDNDKNKEGTTTMTEHGDGRQLSETEIQFDTEGLWEEKFSSHTDSKPHGPMSVGMDISFPGSTFLYGIPEHASSARLQTTRGEGAHFKEPYRLYNLDVFEYELDETMALYGSIPYLVSHSALKGTVGVFWFNPTETFVDVRETEDGSQTHWISESGVIDIFLLPGPDPRSLYRQYAYLTGTSPLPPLFSLGYHQCRWNYKDEKDVFQVHGKFEELDYPYDVLWLDIEHTDGKRYFTWDKGLFPNPAKMQETLAAQGRRMITIIDPHIKRDDNYFIHKEATSKGLYIKNEDGKKDFDGWCWPGSSSYLDFTAEHVRKWWAEQFRYDKYQGSTPSLFTWNDMNEPSVFNGPEVSMSKDLKNLRGEEHREWHNIYGMLFHRATMEGLIHRNNPPSTRPFVLSRAFFAGSQRYGAIWTGDNKAEWEHLQVAAPMLLSMNVAALTFVGADVGGFFGNPDAELFTRWMQAGAYQPFFRGHAHHDSKRREPWMFDDITLVRLRRAAMTRYALLPFWYTVFRESELTGMPVMRMMWMQYPQTTNMFGVDDQYMIGSDLLIKPVTSSGISTIDVIVPADDIWYNAETLGKVSNIPLSPHESHTISVKADVDTGIPVLQRGGSIIPRKLRLRRSAMLMKHDPYTLYVALDRNKMAAGDLYMDDEETFGYQSKLEYAHATFTADFSSTEEGTCRNGVTVGEGWKEFVDSLAADRMIERIVVMGVSQAPKRIVVVGRDDEIQCTYNAQSQVLVLRKPNISAMAEWTILFLSK